MTDQQLTDSEGQSIIRASLDKRFSDIITSDSDASTLFTFTNDHHSWQLKVDRGFVEHIYPDVTLHQFMEGKVCPMLLDHPDTRIEIGADGVITIAEKQFN